MLLAMLIVVIGTTIAINVSHEEKFTIRKSAHVHLLDRAQQYALGLEDWSRIYLRKDLEDSEVDSLDEDWALGIPGLPIEGGYLSGYIEDEQAKFNINSLLESELAVIRFRRLCDNLDVDQRFIAALMDWIDQDFDVRYPDGMEDTYETYRVANREMADISELLLVHNMTPEIYEKLKPHITALPRNTLMNLNTMSETVFGSLDQDLDPTEFIEARETEAFESVDKFVERLQVPLEIEGLSVNSEFFRAHGQVVQGDQSYSVSTLIHRDAEGNTRVINRTLGAF